MSLLKPRRHLFSWAGIGWKASCCLLLMLLSGLVEGGFFSSGPVARCNSLLLQVCRGVTLTAEQVGSRSYAKSSSFLGGGNGEDVQVFLDNYGPWTSTGIKSIRLTAQDSRGRQATTTCRIRVLPCDRTLSVYTCPTAIPGYNANNGTLLLTPPPENNSPANPWTIQLVPSDAGELCTLTMAATVEGQYVQKPVGRSYDGQAWEPYAGNFSSLTYTCLSGSCIVTLPQLETGFQYWLTSRTLTANADIFPPLSARDQAARFLERTTYGATLSEIDALAAAAAPTSDMNTAAARWIQTQVTLPATSHRQFYREHATNIFEYSSSVGVVTHPCQKGSRYRTYAFTDQDAHETLDIVKSAKSGRLLLSIRGFVRTVVDNVIGIFADGKSRTFPVGSYRICVLQQSNQLGGQIRLLMPGVGCSQGLIFGGFQGNPKVSFTDLDRPTETPVVLDGKSGPVDQAVYMGTVQELLVQSKLTDAICGSLPPITGAPYHTVIGVTQASQPVSQRQYWIHSSTFTLLNNTLEEPLPDGGQANFVATQKFETPSMQVACSNAPQTFLNEATCFIADAKSACLSSTQFSEVLIPLEYESLRTIYQATGGAGGQATKYLYAVSQLRQGEDTSDIPPCTPGARSRWIPDCSRAGSVTVSPTTQVLFQRLLAASKDDNPYMIDAYFPVTGSACDTADTKKFNFTVTTLDGRCWLNVHPDTYQVFDFTLWSTLHPGNTNQMNFITAFAEKNNTFELKYPSWHDMFRWTRFRFRLQSIGRLGDTVDSSDLASNLQSDDIAQAFGGTRILNSQGQVVVCGSPFEVQNYPSKYGMVLRGGFDISTSFQDVNKATTYLYQRYTVWLENALRAQDQLRQRVAWALSQILVVSPFSIQIQTQTENFLTYYDIFVRNAFGNYRAILKEVAYSPMMGEMLSYLNSHSTQFTWATQKTIEYADENFAREVMQLFTVGLYELNNDGTLKLGLDGSPTNSYSNDEITEYARAWTGFSRQNKRGNVEDSTDPGINDNQIDPMRINLDWRDWLPKRGLGGTYIGDGWPLCSDLPSQHFLKSGAKFRLVSAATAQNSLPRSSMFVLDSSSALNSKLCNARTDGSCRSKAVVVLDQDLSCVGTECVIDTLGTFQTQSGVFYEYLQRPCVHKAFVSNPKMVKAASGNSDVLCADPTTAVASNTCCSSGQDGSLGATRAEAYTGERVTFATAQSRCAALGMSVCLFPNVLDCNVNACDPKLHYWASQSCSMKAKIGIDGSVALVHNPTAPQLSWNHVAGVVQERSVTFFKVNWSGPISEFLSDYNTQCLAIGCKILSFDGLCICDVTLEESQGFTSSQQPSRDQILSELAIGAFPISGGGGTPLSSNVTMYGTGEDAVFEVVDSNGRTQWRKNTKSVVKLGNRGLSFRNPLHFISLADPQVRDAHYETDATLDHYLYHPNVAPFLAIRFAQRFGESNPSPRYVETIANAFRAGLYTYTAGDVAIDFGTGVYADMEATIAAVLLDREATSLVLDMDLFHGSIQEPMLKLMRVIRSLGYQAQANNPLMLLGTSLLDDIGEGPFEIASVFSFFKPEYQPPGLIEQAGLVAPEAQVLNGPKAIDLANGLLSYLKYGLKNCLNGFGFTSSGCSIGQYDAGANGFATYAPPSGATPAEIVDELAAILTSGRLSINSRDLAATAYNSTIGKGRPASEAVINMQQVMVISPEFNTRGRVVDDGTQRPVPVNPTPSQKPYKAVIYITLDGGYDSYNMLVPQNCTGTNSKGQTVRQQYDTERGVVAFTEGAERSVWIDAKSSNQPCQTFALHDELVLLKSLYDKGDLLFLANTGLINHNGTTQYNYYDYVSQLFAHNSMQLEEQRVDPYQAIPATGVLGRAAGQLASAGYQINSIALNNLNPVVIGVNGGQAPPPLIVDQGGVNQFGPSKGGREAYFNATDYALKANFETVAAQSNIFTETWSDQFVTGIYDSKRLSGYLDQAKLASNVWDPLTYFENPLLQGYFENFNTMAKLIRTHNMRGTDRDVIYTSLGGWDHHAHMKDQIRTRFNALNYGLNMIVTELQAQGLWDNITIVVTSEFARTITPNSGLGTDHAWGGHYFMMGGGLKGGRVLGQYPSDLTDDGPLNVGRGRIIPTTSWEAIWNGVMEWFGVAELDKVLPNRHWTVDAPNFKLFTAADLYGSRSGRRRHLRRG